jgi:autotransporter family porin
VGRQGQYTNLADKQSLFLTNFAPKGSEVDGNGFLNGGEGVVPPKPTEVPSGTGTGTGGNFSENPADGTSGNSHIDKDGNSVCDNDSTLAGCAWPPTPIDPVDPVDPVDPDNIKPTTDPVKPKRLISPDFVTYNAAADVVSLSANTLLGTYHERMGAQNTPLIQAETSTSVNTNSWGRLVADTREVAYDNAAFNQSIQGETMGFQLGHSFWQSRNKDNALGQAGVAIGYVTGSMDVTGDFLTTQQGDAGSVDAQTTSLMAYYTLAANDGRYLDAVLQYSMSSADAQGQLSKLSLDATGLRASLEVGKPVRLDSLTLEPQAQLIAYKDSFDDATDSNGYVMSQADNSGVIFRVGARLTSNDTTAAFKPWFAANINLQNGSTTGITDKTNNVYESSEKDAKWADMSVGMSYQTSSDISVYGHLKQSVAIGGGTNTTTSGAIGVQKVW